VRCAPNPGGAGEWRRRWQRLRRCTVVLCRVRAPRLLACPPGRWRAAELGRRTPPNAAGLAPGTTATPAALPALPLGGGGSPSRSPHCPGGGFSGEPGGTRRTGHTPSPRPSGCTPKPGRRGGATRGLAVRMTCCGVPAARVARGPPRAGRADPKGDSGRI
jgi:hypothetical protein